MVSKKKEKVLAAFDEPLFKEGELDPTEQELEDFEESFGTVGQNTPQMIVPILDIVLPKDQPRKYFDEQSLRALSESIREKGVLQPIVVRKLHSGKYELIAGERRLKASRMAKRVHIPVIVHNVDDKEARSLQLVENLQREDLNAVEETLGTIMLISEELELSVEEVKALLYRIKHQKAGSTSGNNVITSQVALVERVFREVGRFSLESFVINRLPLLQMPEDVLLAIQSGQLEYTKAVEIGKKLKNHDQLRSEVLKEAIASKMPIRSLRERIKEVLNPHKNNKNKSLVSSSVKQFKKQIETLITTHGLENDKVLIEIIEEAESKIADYCATLSETA